MQRKISARVDGRADTSSVHRRGARTPIDASGIISLFFVMFQFVFELLSVHDGHTEDVHGGVPLDHGAHSLAQLHSEKKQIGEKTSFQKEQANIQSSRKIHGLRKY